MANVLSNGQESSGHHGTRGRLLGSLPLRMTGVSEEHYSSLLEEVGNACRRISGLRVAEHCAKRVQVDEIKKMEFLLRQGKECTADMWERVGYAGDVWTFTAIDADTNVVLSWLVGRRDAGCAAEFLQDVAARLTDRIQLTTDGHEDVSVCRAGCLWFRYRLRYVGLRFYGNDPVEGQKRYSPAQCLGTERIERIGTPIKRTSLPATVERQNLTMRMNMRRYTPLD